MTQDSSHGRKNDILIPLSVLISAVSILVSIQMSMGRVVDNNTKVENRLATLETKVDLLYDRNTVIPVAK